MMSNNKEEEWTVVKINKRKTQPTALSVGKLQPKQSNGNESFNYRKSSSTKKIKETVEKTKDYYIEDINKCITKFKLSNYYKHLAEILQSYELRKLHEIVILGVGSPSGSLNARWQLIWILVITEILSNRFLNGEPISLSLYDPLLETIDNEICLHFNIRVLTENNKGFINPLFREDGNEIEILYYMPHCPYRLYCNILWSMWQNLRKIAIIGNSFKSYEFRRQSYQQQPIENITDSIKFVTPHISESSVWNFPIGRSFPEWEYKHQWEAAFCDTSFMFLKSLDVIKTLQSLKPDDTLIQQATELDKEVF